MPRAHAVLAILVRVRAPPLLAHVTEVLVSRALVPEETVDCVETCDCCGRFANVTRDLPPYGSANGNPARLFGLTGSQLTSIALIAIVVAGLILRGRVGDPTSGSGSARSIGSWNGPVEEAT